MGGVKVAVPTTMTLHPHAAWTRPASRPLDNAFANDAARDYGHQDCEYSESQKMTCHHQKISRIATCATLGCEAVSASYPRSPVPAFERLDELE
jgi:hypothetical protein